MTYLGPAPRIASPVPAGYAKDNNAFPFRVLCGYPGISDDSNITRAHWSAIASRIHSTMKSELGFEDEAVLVDRMFTEIP